MTIRPVKNSTQVEQNKAGKKPNQTKNDMEIAELLNGNYIHENSKLAENFMKDGNLWIKRGLFKTINNYYNMDSKNLRTVFPSDKVIITPKREHIIKPGDTFEKLAKKYHVSPTRIANANTNIKDPRKLKENQRVIIPESASLDFSKIKTLDDVFEATGISRMYIKDFMEVLEVANVDNILVTYNDKVPGKGTNSKGTPTIGYGHTGLVRGKPITDATEITPEEAAQLLALDLFNCKIEAIAHYGNDFLNAPHSIQDGIVDNFYNKGWVKGFVENKPSKEIKNDLKNMNYAAVAADLLYETPSKGLKKRVLYRIIYATKDLLPEERKKALDKRRAFYQEVLKEFSSKNDAPERALMVKAWNNAYEKGQCDDFFIKSVKTPLRLF